MSYPIISTFNDIIIPQDKTPLIICDIDHTLIRPKNNFNFYYNTIKDKYDSEEDRIEMANQLLQLSYNIGVISLTDKEGFQNLLERINKLNGKLIFLTARGADFHEKTLEDLKYACLEDHNTFDIHYTNAKITKGEYIKINRSLLDGYNHISFIDDYTSYLDSVYNLHPHINCYQFKW
jgi:hypothetical protein